jgi:hypothetical protein
VVKFFAKTAMFAAGIILARKYTDSWILLFFAGYILQFAFDITISKGWKSRHTCIVFGRIIFLVFLLRATAVLFTISIVASYFFPERIPFVQIGDLDGITAVFLATVSAAAVYPINAFYNFLWDQSSKYRRQIVERYTAYALLAAGFHDSIGIGMRIEEAGLITGYAWYEVNEVVKEFVTKGWAITTQLESPYEDHKKSLIDFYAVTTNGLEHLNRLAGN